MVKNFQGGLPHLTPPPVHMYVPILQNYMADVKWYFPELVEARYRANCLFIFSCLILPLDVNSSGAPSASPITAPTMAPRNLSRIRFDAMLMQIYRVSQY